MYNEHKVLSKFINRIKTGEKIALISDAGHQEFQIPDSYWLENVSIKKLK